MTIEELAKEIAKGLIETGIEGGYGSVSCSTAGDYPSIGCSQWEGGRADELLESIPGGEQYAHRTYSDLEYSGDLDGLMSCWNPTRDRQRKSSFWPAIARHTSKRSRKSKRSTIAAA